MKQALVTGGVRGIGLATARQLNEQGYAVTLTYAKDEESATHARAEGFKVIRADVSKEGDVERLFKEIGSVDVLINNAGVSLVKQLQDTTLDEWNNLFAVNVTGAYLCSRLALEGMLKKGKGVIVNLSSIWGVIGGSCEVAYSASKAALIGFTKALAKEVGFSGIRVNCVAPGAIDTRMNDCFSSKTLQSLAEEIPAGRLGRAEEVAKAICMLCENEYVTGQVLTIDGGFGL